MKIAIAIVAVGLVASPFLPSGQRARRKTQLVWRNAEPKQRGQWRCHANPRHRSSGQGMHRVLPKSWCR